MKRLLLPLIFLIFAWGIALRAVEVINGNYLFGFDQGRDYLAAYNIAVNHKLTLIGAEVGAGAAGLSGIFHGPGYYYLIALMYFLFHGDPYGGLLLMFLFGVATLIITFVTVKKIFGMTTAVLTLFLVGISPLIVSQSRFMWNHHPSSMLIVIVLYFAYMISKKPRLYAPLAIFFAALIYHFEIAISLPVVVSLLIALPLVFRIKDIKTYLYSFASLLFVFSPFLIFQMRHGWMAVRSALSYMTPQGPVGSDVWFLRIMDHSGPYIANAANSFAIEHGLLPGILVTILCGALLVALVVYSWKTKNKFHRQFFRFMLLLLAISYGTLLLLDNHIWDYYLIHAHVVYIYVFAYSLIHSFEGRQKSVWSKLAFGVLTLFLLSMIVSSSWRMMISYTSDIHDSGGVEKIQGKKFAIDYIYKDAAGALPAGRQAFSEFTFMAPIYTYPYDYLFKTYGKQKYGFEPGTQKKGLIYLIIEPDTSKLWTYKGWLETVIVGGDIIKTITLPTGHIIQVRQFP